MSLLRLKQLAQDGATDGQHMTWNNAAGKWEPSAVPMVQTPQQESVTTEVITGTDTALADTLSATPVSNNAVRLYLNGLLQVQGAGADYTIAGSTITWLASSGTAVDMDTSDELVAVYDS